MELICSSCNKAIKNNETKYNCSECDNITGEECLIEKDGKHYCFPCFTKDTPEGFKRRVESILNLDTKKLKTLRKTKLKPERKLELRKLKL